jgi:aspartate racemase
MIGIVGGIGSYAGIDLIRKIYDFSEVSCDQDHLPVSMLSAPHKVVDRTQFLLGNISVNPGRAIGKIIQTLSSNGASIIGIPCNTAHAELIFNLIKQNTPQGCKIIHLVEEVARYIQFHYPKLTKIGILGTTGTLISKIYPDIFQRYNLEVIEPSNEIQTMFVSPSIYDKEYGIKSVANPVDVKAKQNLITAATYLSRKGAEAIVLGCTEIPLAITESVIENSIVIDATSILAQALIRESKYIRNLF